MTVTCFKTFSLLDVQHSRLTLERAVKKASPKVLLVAALSVILHYGSRANYQSSPMTLDLWLYPPSLSQRAHKSKAYTLFSSLKLNENMDMGESGDL